MYYKLLNKTLLTSAMLAIIGVNMGKVCAQEIVFEDDNVDITIPAPADAAPVIIEEDIIPLDKQAMIEPAAQPFEPGGKAPANTQNAPLPATPEKAPADDAFVLGDDTLLAPSQENIVNDMGAPKAEAPLPVAAPSAPTKPAQVNAPVNNTNPRPALKKRTEEGAQNAPQKSNPKPSPRSHKSSGNETLEPKFGDAVLAQTNNELFNKMSDIEKQTTLLTLELKREKILNEVEAAKAVRERAEQEKVAMEEAKKRQAAEWEKEQEAKVIREQVQLKQKEIELEKVKQRKALTAYMNSMLEQKQLWIEQNGKLLDEIANLKDTNQKLRTAYKEDLDKVFSETSELKAQAETAQANHTRIVASLTAQNAQLKKRIEADAEAARKGGQNPFSEGGTAADGSLSSSADAFIKPINVAKEYAIMDITGQGGELFVKLINKAGDSFMAKVGTVLQTGHVIEEITPNYVQFDRNGLKDFLYTSTSALETEPNNINGTGEFSGPKGAGGVDLVRENSVPSVVDSMFVK